MGPEHATCRSERTRIGLPNHGQQSQRFPMPRLWEWFRRPLWSMIALMRRHIATLSLVSDRMAAALPRTRQAGFGLFEVAASRLIQIHTADCAPVQSD